MEKERGDRAVDFGYFQRPPQGVAGCGRVAECVSGDRLEHVGVREPGGRRHGYGAGEDRCELDGRRVRIVLGDPQRRDGHAYFAAGAALLAVVRDVLLGPLGFTQPDQGVQPQGAGPHERPLRRVEEPGQPLGGLEGRQHVLVMPARQLKQRAHVADRHRRPGLGFRPEGALGAPHPIRRLLKPPPPDQPRREPYVGDAGGRLVGPAVPPGQFDRLPGALFRQRVWR
jgi:hypothetical protein